jgi:hypothetical protein
LVVGGIMTWFGFDVGVVLTGSEASAALVVIVSDDLVPVLVFCAQPLIVRKIAISARIKSLRIFKSIFDSFIGF